MAPASSRRWSLSGLVRSPVMDEPRGLAVAKHIVCVDCGGLCHLMSHEPPEGWEPDDVVAYRCEDCLDRWDIVLEDGDNDPYG